MGDYTSFNRLKGFIENPNSLQQPNTSQYNSISNSMSPAVMSTPSSYLGVATNSGYNMAAATNNYRGGGGSGNRSMLDIRRAIPHF